LGGLTDFQYSQTTPFPDQFKKDADQFKKSKIQFKIIEWQIGSLKSKLKICKINLKN